MQNANASNGTFYSAKKSTYNPVYSTLRDCSNSPNLKFIILKFNSYYSKCTSDLNLIIKIILYYFLGLVVDVT